MLPSGTALRCAALRRGAPSFPERCPEQQQRVVRAPTVPLRAFAERKICSEAAAALVVPAKRAAYADELPANGGLVAVSSCQPALAEWSSPQTNGYSSEQAAGGVWNGKRQSALQGIDAERRNTILVNSHFGKT